MRAVHSGQRSQRRAEICRATGGLIWKDIEACTDPALANGLLESCIVDHFTAGSVDEDGAFLHSREERFAKQAASVLGKSEVDAHDVGRCRNIFDCWKHLDG